MSTPVNCTWRSQLESLGYATLVTAHISPFIIYVICCSSFFPFLQYTVMYVVTSCNSAKEI